MPNGFGEELKKWQKEAEFWAGKEKTARTELEELQEPPWWEKPLTWAWGTFKTFNFPLAGPIHTIITGEPVPPEIASPFTARRVKEVTEQQDIWTEAISQTNRASFFTTLYQVAPIGISSGKISSFDDVLELFHGKLENLSDEDIELARGVVNKMLSQPGAPTELLPEEIPEWLEVPPEERAKVEEFLEEPLETRPRFKGIHITTVEEMTKWLKKEVSLVEAPKGLSDEDVLSYAARMGLTEEQLTAGADYGEIAGIIGEAWEEQQSLIDSVLSGEAEWEMPKMTIGERLKYAALQPFQAIADAIKPYLEFWNYPLAGFAQLGIMKLIPGLQEQEILYKEARATDNWWMASSKAWEENDMNWGVKLAMEIITDPVSYIGLGLVPKALKGISLIPRLGRVGRTIGRAGRACGAFEDAFNAFSAIPFDWLKAKWARVPKIKVQVIKAEDAKFLSTLNVAVGARTRKIPKFWTHDDIMETLAYSVERYHADTGFATKGAQDYFSELGRYLVDMPPLKPGDIARWTKQLDGKLLFSEITARTIDNINNVLYDVLAKKGSVSENASRLFGILMVEGDTAKLKTATLLLKQQMGKVGSRLVGIANVKTPGGMLSTLASQQHKIIEMTARSEFANSRLMAGSIGGLMNHISHLESTVWRNRLDRMFVRPMAEAYLGFTGYPVWNAFEDMFRSSIEGVLPKQMTLEHFQLVTLKLKIRDIGLATGGASDVRGMLGSISGREGMKHFIPGKIPESIVGKVPIVGKTIGGAQITEWLGQHWIELSNTWGNAFRRNFVSTKFLQILSKRGRSVLGRDITEDFNSIINRAGRIPRIRGTKPHDLKNEAFARLQTGDRDIVLGMKETVGNTAFMEKEQMKILRLADELTPQARTLGEQGILAGDAIRDPSGYAKAIADQVTEDIRMSPLQMVDNFESMADRFVGETITTQDNLIQAFQTLEISEDVASTLPYRMMSQTHEVSDNLMSRGKFGKIIRDLWTGDRTEMLNSLDRITIANQRIKRKILDSIPAAKLTGEQDHALRELLEHITIRDELKATTVRADGDLLDVFWRKPKVERTPEAYHALRAERGGLWDAYRKADADYFANEFLMRRSYASLYNKIPKRPVLAVDAVGRNLVPNDIARILGCNVDEVTSTILDVAILQDRDHFVRLIKKLADADPTNFKGFTDDGISKTYGAILDNVHIKPDVNIQLQKSLMQVEGIKQEMMTLKQVGFMTSAEEAQAFKWVDNIVSGMDELMYEPAKVIPAAKVLKPEFKNWNTIRQESWDEALKSYYSAFTDYSHENVIDFTMKHIFPYWTYESQRWFFLPRTFVRRPGILAAWGKYANYAENGYFPLPGTDLQIAGARGTVFGLTYSLTRRDYPFYYQQLGPIAEVTDWLMRVGFYPGAHFMFPIVTLPAFTGRPPNWGESMPALYKTGLNVFAASPIDGVRENAQWLTDHVFHENFRDYNIVTKVDELQSKAGGKLFNGQSGQELWIERREFPKDRKVWDISNEEYRLKEQRLADGLMTPEEIETWEERKRIAAEKETIWDEAATYRAWLGLLMENITIFRLRPEEQVEAFKRVTALIEAQTGLTEEQQDYLWKHNMRPTDVCPGIMSPALRRAMGEMWEYRIWLGRGVVLKPEKWGELDAKTTRFWSTIDDYQKDRVGAQQRLDNSFLNPTPTEHLKGREWLDEVHSNWSTYITKFDSLKQADEYAEVALTLDERAEQLKQQGYPAPTASMFDEILRIYYQIKPETVKNKYTGEEDTDWVGFYIKREAIRMALPENLRDDFDAYVRNNETPLERKHREVVNTYFRGYWAVQEIILRRYTEEEKALIAEFYADTTGLSRKEEIRDYVRPATGNQLISEYTSTRTNARIKLRMISPKLDFYLYVFGYVSTTKTDEARAMVDTFDRDRMSLL